MSSLTTARIQFIQGDGWTGLLASTGLILKANEVRLHKEKNKATLMKVIKVEKIIIQSSV